MSETHKVEVVETDNDIVMDQLIILLEEKALVLEKSLEKYKDKEFFLTVLQLI